MSTWFPLSDTDPDDLLTALSLEVFQLNGLLMARGNEITREHQLTSALWHVLGAISQGPLTQAAIARRMGLARQSVRRSVQILEERGLVESRPNPDHKRARLIHLTEQGRRTLDAVLADWFRAIAPLHQGLDNEQLKQTRDVLRTLCERLNINNQGE